MAASSESFPATVTETGTAYNVSAKNLFIVLASGTGSKLFYNVQGSELKQIIVDESPAAITTASASLIPLTDVDTGATFRLNPDYFTQVVTNGTGSKIYFDQLDAENRIYSVTESRAAIAALVTATVAQLP